MIAEYSRAENSVLGAFVSSAPHGRRCHDRLARTLISYLAKPTVFFDPIFIALPAVHAGGRVFIVGNIGHG